MKAQHCLIVLFCILTSYVSSAQLTISPEAGLGLNKIKYYEHYYANAPYKTKPAFDFNIGGLLQFQRNSLWKLNVGLKYHAYRGKLFNYTVYMKALELPFIANYCALNKKGSTVFVGGGLYLDIIAGNKLKYSSADTSFTLTNPENVVVGTNLGLIINTEYHFKQPVYLRAQYQYCLFRAIDLFSAYGFSRGISIIAGYKFQYTK